MNSWFWFLISKWNITNQRKPFTKSMYMIFDLFCLLARLLALILAIHSGNRSITCAHFIDCIFQSHIKLLGCSVMRSKPSRMCMTLLECFKFDLIYWMFLGNAEMSVDPKEPIQSIGFQRIFHSDKSRNFLRFICVKIHLNFRLSFQFKGMLWKKIG